jgi:hypothetical protein
MDRGERMEGGEEVPEGLMRGSGIGDRGSGIGDRGSGIGEEMNHKEHREHKGFSSTPSLRSLRSNSSSLPLLTPLATSGRGEATTPYLFRSQF